MSPQSNAGYTLLAVKILLALATGLFIATLL